MNKKPMKKYKIAVLDDYQNAALECADRMLFCCGAFSLSSSRHIVTESNSVRSGGWQQTVGTDLRGKTLGVLGLGNVGSQVARIGTAFGMKLIAWSQNMTPESAKA